MSNLTSFILHSGGAEGSDMYWDAMGKKYKIAESKHYYIREAGPPNNNANYPMPMDPGIDDKLKKANITLNRKFPTNSEKVNNLLRRNWYQVEQSEAIFAIATINNNIVDGGTGWAVQMAINEIKPVYVFDQGTNEWFGWNDLNKEFKKIMTPILTQNFAGIGTRKINEKGKKAIENVFHKTDKEKVVHLNEKNKI